MRRARLVIAIGSLLWLAVAPARVAEPKRVGFSILEDYDNGEPLTDVVHDFELFRELGITTWRGSFAWDHYEPARGTYDFAWLERFAALAAAHGITLRPYLAYTPQWASAGTSDADAWNDPPKPRDWSAFVGALARAMRRHPNVVSFEIYNEEDMPQWWDGTPAAYNDVLRRAYDAIRRANPRLQVMFGGMVYPDARWVGYACGVAHNGQRFAILPFHAYPETWEKEDVEHYLGARFDRDFVDPADRACGRKPIWINETGYATIDGKTETDQAEWWARAVATFAAAPRVEHIGVYEIKDLRPGHDAIGGAANYHLGITRADRTKKIAFGTVRRLAALLGTGAVTVDDDRLQVTSRDGDVGTVYRHLFTRHDAHQIVFLWDKTTAITVDARLPRGGARAVEYAINGGASDVDGFAGSLLSHVRLEPGEVRMFEVVP